MARIRYSYSLRQTRMTATRNALASGTLEIRDASANALVGFVLSVSGGTITAIGDWELGFVSSTVNAALGGEAATGVLKNSGGTVLADDLSVGVSGDVAIKLSSLLLTAGQPVTVTAAAVRHAGGLIPGPLFLIAPDTLVDSSELIQGN